ncbi:MAG: septum formation initiator family protein [Lachnospiraceae bacterium]|nr:septum formation initiator family protein [Lachnospiraceae bacterium]
MAARSVAKAKSRRIRERNKNLGAWVILLIVVLVLGVSTVGCMQLRQKNKAYQAREEALEESLAEEEERTEELEEFEAYTQTKKYVEEVAKDKLGLVYEDEIIFKAE